jgi:hypothetical protein
MCADLQRPITWRHVDPDAVALLVTHREAVISGRGDARVDAMKPGRL